MLTDAEVREIDELLWLSLPGFAKNVEKRKVLHIEATRIGKETAKDYPVNMDNIVLSLENINVNGLEFFSKEDSDRAYYMVDERKIYVNELFIIEMADYFKSQAMPYYTFETIKNALVLHEAYHHIEETITKPTDELLESKFNTFVPQIYRDIAAFSYANSIMGTTICQMIDIFWLKKHHPRQFKAFYQ